MKNLLNITVFASAVLSIFSTSLTLYEVPDLKEALLLMDKEKEIQESNLERNMKRIYISHNVSNKDKEKSTPLIVANDSKNFSTSAEDYISVFGVKVSSNKNRSNI